MRRPPRLAAFGAAALVAVALLAIGLATAPTQQTAQQSTTTTVMEPVIQPTTTVTFDDETFSVADIATGERLSWRRAPAIGNRWPIDLIEHHGRLYLFTSQTPSGGPSPTPGDLEVRVSDNGLQWQQVAEIAGVSVTKVASTGDELVALGTSAADDSPHVWISADGVEWNDSPLPQSSDTPVSTRFTDAVRHDGQLIVAGTTYPNPESTIVDYLPPEVAAHADRMGTGLTEGPEGRSIEVYGPLGILGYQSRLEDLGVDPDTANDLFDQPSTEKPHVWISHDGIEWQSHENPDVSIERLWSRSNGTLLAWGWGPRGSAVWSSTDAMTWDLIGRAGIEVVGEWDDSLIGVDWNGNLLRSSDGGEWESLATDSILPRQLGWSLNPVGAGSGGIAAIATTWSVPGEQPARTNAFIHDSYTLSMDYNTGTLTIGGVDGRAVMRTWTNDPEESVTVDFAREEMTFFDSETGTELVTVDFETLRQVERAFFGPRDAGERALLLSRGDESWSVLDLGEEIGDREHVALLRVWDDRLVLVTFPIEAWGATSPPAISVRVATLG